MVVLSAETDFVSDFRHWTYRLPFVKKCSIDEIYSLHHQISPPPIKKVKIPKYCKACEQRLDEVIKPIRIKLH